MARSTRRWLPGLLVALVALAACARVSGPPVGPSGTELGRAIELGERAVAGSGARPADYRVIRAINLRAPDGSYRGPGYWQLTFKLRSLVPATADAELGAGGEIFVDVDTSAAVARITGHGE